MLKKIDKTYIRNILSIRYDPSKKPLTKPAKISDFLKETFDPNGIITEQKLKKSIQHIVPNNKEPLSISLSGGIDSTLTLALVRKVFPEKKITAICGVFEEGFNESITAKKIASKFNANFKIVKMDSIFTNMPEIISVTKKPKWNTYSHLIAKEAKKFSNILITGDGADEIFGGYTFRYSKFLNLHRPKDNWRIKTINYLECHNRDWVSDQEYLFGSSIKFNWNSIYNYFKPYFSNKLEPLKQVMIADYNGKLLYDFIPMGNEISHHYKIQTLSPFLQSEVISYGLGLPIKHKFESTKKQGKLTLRKISNRLGIKHINEKRGFSPSLFNDWRKNGREICQSYILEKNSYIFKKKLINYNWVLRAFEKAQNDGDIRYLNRLISILALEIWYRIFITKEMKSTKKL